MEDLVGKMGVAGAYTSIHKLIELAEREGVTHVIFGHDAHRWKTLKIRRIALPLLIV